MEPYRGHGCELQVPRGWTATVDEAAGTLFVTEDSSDPTSAGSLAAQQMYLDMQSRMFLAWSNNLGGSARSWGDSSPCF